MKDHRMMEMVMTPIDLVITDADRQAACDLIGTDSYGKPVWTVETISDCNRVVVAFAKHRIASALSPAPDRGEVKTTDGYLVNAFTLEDVLAEMLAVATASLTEDEDIMDEWPIDCRADVDRWQAVICGHLEALKPADATPARTDDAGQPSGDVTAMTGTGEGVIRDAVLDGIIDNPRPAHEDKAFATVWRQLELRGYLWSEGNVEKVHLGWLLARAIPIPAAEEKPAGAEYLIRKGSAYYRPNAQGYTCLRSEAGRYSLEDAISYSHPNGPDGPRDGITYELASSPAPAGDLREAIARIIAAGSHGDPWWWKDRFDDGSDETAVRLRTDDVGIADEILAALQKGSGR